MGDNGRGWDSTARRRGVTNGRMRSSTSWTIARRWACTPKPRGSEKGLQHKRIALKSLPLLPTHLGEHGEVFCCPNALLRLLPKPPSGDCRKNPPALTGTPPPQPPGTAPLRARPEGTRAPPAPAAAPKPPPILAAAPARTLRRERASRNRPRHRPGPVCCAGAPEPKRPPARPPPAAAPAPNGAALAPRPEGLPKPEDGEPKPPPAAAPAPNGAPRWHPDPRVAETRNAAPKPTPPREYPNAPPVDACPNALQSMPVQTRLSRCLSKRTSSRRLSKCTASG